MLFPNWSRLIQSGRIRRSRRPMDVSSAELLERRTVPTVGISGSSSVTILITSNENVTVGVDSGTGFVQLDVDGMMVDTTIDAAFVQSLTIKATNSSSPNIIKLDTISDTAYVLLAGITVKAGGGED